MSERVHVYYSNSDYVYGLLATDSITVVHVEGLGTSVYTKNINMLHTCIYVYND